MYEIIFMYFIYGIMARDCGVVRIFKETQSCDGTFLILEILEMWSHSNAFPNAEPEKLT